MHWHDYLALSVLAAASGYVVFRVYSALFAAGTSGCAAACGSCPQTNAGPSPGKNLLSIDGPPQKS